MKPKHLPKRIRQLRYIAGIKDPKLRRRVLSDLSEDKAIYQALCEIAKYTVKGGIPLTLSQKRSLRPHRNTIRALSQPTTLKSRRKRLVVQSGGLLPLLLIPLLATLGKAAAVGAAGAAGGLAVKKILD